jgi:class 3 adenylate cyclase/TolB-like protein/pimeloyl-ACP methyl ester carboxylesterase/Tfp pilus assembly protein PilF
VSPKAVRDMPEGLASDQTVRFCTALDGTKIAYAITGKGPPLVRAAHYLSHLEYDFESPVWSHWIRELSRYNTYIRYDERGCGLSDQYPRDFSFDAWVTDLETVVDSLALEKFDLLGVSQGGSVAIAYAAKHPDRVKHLILYGAYARGWGTRPTTSATPEALETRKAIHRLIGLGWGQDNPAFRQVFTSLFIPEAGAEQQKWFNELQRVSCSPGNAMKFDEVFSGIDVAERLKEVAVPTLILHARHDDVVPLEEGKLLASGIPGARFVSFEGRNHILLNSENGWRTLLREYRRFTGLPEGEESNLSQERADNVNLPLFNETVPGGLRFGTNYLVEFEPRSLWFETSLTLCAQALRMGMKVDYHTFTHVPADIRASLKKLGLDVKTLEENDTLRMVDSYTIQTGIGEPEKAVGYTVDTSSVSMDDWTRADIEDAGEPVRESDKQRFHIDDDTSILVQFNGEAKVVAHFRTQTVPFARRREMSSLHSVLRGVFSESFYAQFESFCDGIFEFKSEDSARGLVHSMRVRAMRGAPHDSSWKRIRLLDTGEVTLDGNANLSTRAFAEETATTEGERRLAAIMFTDMVGFTALTQKNEAGAMKLLEEQRGIVRPIIARHRGREVKTIGDAFLVEFSSSLDAVRCASAIQSALAGENKRRSSEERILLRIGIHLGDVIHEGSDVAGDAVNVASRIETLAPPGGICVTSQIHDSVANKIDLNFSSLGTPELKNVATPVEVFQVLGFGEELARPAARGGLAAKDRIAVLPITNIGQDKSEDYFADGMTEELISSVSKTDGLRVIARTSVMKYKGTSKSISEIGRELNVGSVLEGSVRKAGEQLRITIQLVDTSNEEPKWSQKYDRDIRDVFAIQGDIAKQVAEALRLQLLRGAEAVPTAPVSTEAYVDYLRGRQAWSRRNQEGLNQAISFFQKALAADGSYAKAYTGLADSYATLALLEISAPNDVYPKAKEAVSKALSLDPQLAEAHTSLGLIRFQYDWDWKGAEEEFKEAIRLNPSYAPARHYFADLLKAMGRFDEALSEISRAQELDPLNLAINTGVGHVLYLSRQYDKAIDQYKKAVDLDPNFMATHLWFGRPYLEKGMFPEAISELETAVKLSGESTLALAMLGHGLASAGRKEEAMQVLEKLKERSKSQYVPSYWIAVVYNGFKDKDEVLAWLARAYEERSSWLVWSNVEPRFAWLRGDPGFEAVMGKMKFP